MNASSIERLFIKQGEEPTAAHLRQLDAAIALQTPLKSVSVRRRIFPWGTHEHYEATGGASSFVAATFQPTVTQSGGNFEIAWQRGLINGVEPTIEKKPISSGRVYRVPASMAKETGEILVFFRVALNPDAWYVEKAEPFAASATPKLEPFTADKLALTIQADGTVWRSLVSDQGLLSLNRRSSGLAQHIFYSKFSG